MADRDMGSIARGREIHMLDFDLDASEFHGTEWVQEDEEISPLTAARALGKAAPSILGRHEPERSDHSARAYG